MSNINIFNLKLYLYLFCKFVQSNKNLTQNSIYINSKIKPKIYNQFQSKTLLLIINTTQTIV